MTPDNQSPLSWPLGWERCYPNTQSSRFSYTLTVHHATEGLLHELEMLGAKEVIISSNMRYRNDGLPYSNQKAPQDPGVAVYFKLKNKETVLACDKWNRYQDNIRAITKHIEALRGQDRWGVGNLDMAFTGYQALPAKGETSGKHWKEVLGLEPEQDYTFTEVQKAYKSLVKKAHPDLPTGSQESFRELQTAMEQAKANYIH